MNSFLIFQGPSWKNCGASAGQEQALASDQAFQKMVTTQYQLNAGQNQQILSDLTGQLENIFNAGPSQQGMSPAELAVQNSQALNSAAAANKQVQQQIGERAATNGVVPGVESGVIQSLRTSAATQVENNLSNQQAQITQKNYDLGRENYLNAEKGLIDAPAALEGATNQTGGVVNNSNKDTADQANENQKANSQWIGLVEGLASDAASIGSAGISGGKK